MDLVKILDILTLQFEHWGYLIIFFGSLIEISPFGWVVPGSAILIVAGYLSNGNQNIPLVSIIIWGTLGAWFALLLAFLLGKKTGLWLVKKLHQERNADFAKKMLKNNGAVILTTSMMANLTRFWISYIAGVEKYNIIKFSIYSFFASLSWVSVMVLLGYFAGFEKENLNKIIGSAGVLSWIFLLIAAIVIFIVIKHEHKHLKEDTLHK